MFTLSLSTLRDRRQLFAGALVAIALGVALVQASLHVLTSVSDPVIPAGLSAAERDEMREGFVGASVVMGLQAPLVVFLAVFVVGSTCSFAVAQRRRDLALLRLLGAGRGQTRRLLVTESLVLGAAGALCGAPLGVVMTWIQTRVLEQVGFVPAGFQPVYWNWGAVLAAGATGAGIALLGSWNAARRAGRVRPLEAMADTGAAARVMTPGRWCAGVLSLALSALLVAGGQAADPIGAITIAMALSVVGAVALSALSPLVVPLVARLFGLVFRRSLLGGLAEANIRDGARRNASVAAPLITLVALVLGLSGALGVLARSIGVEQERLTRGDLVVTSADGASAARLAGIPGVADVSSQLAVPASVTAKVRKDGARAARPHTFDERVVAVDGAAYERARTLAPTSGSLADLHGDAVAVGPAVSAEGFSTPRVGDTVTVTADGVERVLRVVAVLPETLEIGDEFLIAKDALPTALLAAAPGESIVTVAPGASVDEVAERIRAAGIGDTESVAQWAQGKADVQQDGNDKVFAVLLGLAGVYALIGVINALVIATAERRTEFAVARLSGLERRQVVRMAVVEACAVATIGLVLGGLVAAAGMAGMAKSTAAATGTAIVVVPWGTLAATVLGAFAVTVGAAVLTARAATRERPAALAAART
ncbi:ABC transporter permease [Yinghuangia soli]|uniref:ABC transporter permease n=1 Tax=Yinghuangia soli TaxID=2908204 RepID=A0AA41Q548_9ACTN|nr:ABC transporter permease [Yinghuangia soli]MCF2531397.1 ABC transporter permease [Yinghuangia soli]